MPVDESVIKRVTKEALSEMNLQGCNEPLVNGVPVLGDTIVPTWEVLFSCDNPANENDRLKAKFHIETPSEKSESKIKEEISSELRKQLGGAAGLV